MPSKQAAKKGKDVPVVQSSTRNNKKEIALLESIHQAENHQLTSFIKERNQVLDAKIKTLRHSLNQSDKLIPSTAAHRLNISGVGLGRVDLDSDAITHSHGTHPHGATAQGIKDSATEKTEKSFIFDPSKTKVQPSGPKEHWVIFLARIKLKMEDANMEAEELRELLLPSDLENSDEFLASYEHVTGVLQTDLLMPVTANDQVMLLKHYGNAYKEIDVKQLLSDAGVWSELPAKRKNHDGFYPPDSQSKEPLDPTAIRLMHEERAKNQAQQYDSLLAGPSRGDGLPSSAMDKTHPPSQTQQLLMSNTQKDSLPITKAERTFAKHADILSQSSRNIDELNELHALINEETGNHLGKHSGANKDNFLEDIMDTALVSSTSTHGHKDSKGHSDTISGATASPVKKSSSLREETKKADNSKFGSEKDDELLKDVKELSTNTGANRPMTAIERENFRLKQEIGAFDTEFFEQLEDLKHRYARLQEIVGESPAVPRDLEVDRYPYNGKILMSTERPTGDYLTNVSAGRGSLPLDKLGWSVRNSMTAMDRAGLTSPLVSGRRAVHASTYAPGAGAAGIMRNSYEERVGGTTMLGREREYPQYGRGNEYLDDVISSSTASHPLSLHHTTGSTRMGGFNDIGTGTHSILPSDGRMGEITGAGTYSNLCERRLAFELSNHPNPEQATSALIHRVMDIATRKGQDGFVTCPQLSDVISSVGLNIAPKEVEVLAYGLASNAKGGVNATEFCDIVKTMLYNMIGEHHARVAESRMMMTDRQNIQAEEDQYDRLLVELCEGILIHDKRAVLGTSPNIYKTLARPFLEYDIKNTGIIDFETFVQILKDMGSMLTFQDLSVLAYRHMELGENAPVAQAGAHMDHISTFRNKKLTGSLRGAAKVKPSFGEFLSNSGIAFDKLDEENGRMSIRYDPFIRDMETMLEIMMDKQGGVVLGTGKYPWVLKEYEFVDALICQLEAMKPSQRRRCLIAFQYALSAADPKQECEVDGFTVLNSLLTAGFQLQRANKVRLLTAIETMGGKIDYRDLTQILLSSCADWTNEEKSVVKKILKAMGVTVIDRRSWLARLRQVLMESSAKMARKTGDWMLMSSRDAISSNNGIPPATFLHCLRDCNVVLNVEEEATLLDCLDTERLSKMGQVEVQAKGVASRSLIAGKDNWSVPLIEYETFLNFCARHCGSWIDSTPEVNEILKETISHISNPVLAVHEFASLIAGFDETSSGYISERAFQICCHRSRLLANLSDDVINDLSDVLTMDGGGKVGYTAFIIHLRTLTSRLSAQSGHAPTIIEQLIKNATDHRGTLLPLRNWLIKNTDIETCILTSKDMNGLLREFSVLYRPDDLESLQMDIGRHVDASKTNIDVFDEATLSHAAGGKSNTSKKHVIDSRDLMAQIIKTRSHWTSIHSHLCRKILKCLHQAGDEFYAANDIASTDNLTAKKSRPTVKGSETAIARRILARLKAFSQDSIASDYHSDDKHKHQMVEKNIFAQLVRVTGLSLNDEDILVLADATDCLPEASRIRCDVILDVLTVAHDGGAYLKGDEEGHHESQGVDMTEAGIFAMNHLRELLWSNARSLHRTPLEWNADVRTVVRGFDANESGFITVEDFVIALGLLNATISNELLMDIPYIPQGPGLVHYKELLDYVLTPPQLGGKDKTGRDGSVGGHSSHYGTTSKGGLMSTAGLSAETKRKLSLKKKVIEKESPVKMLLNVVRRSIDNFIVTDSTMEEAWICLLRVFQRFDPQETNKVTPRDFCLAISVLIEGDDVVLTKAEWAEIIDHFKATEIRDIELKKHSKTESSSGFYDNTLVDYMIFCETVLDPNEIKHRQMEIRQGGFGGTSSGFRDSKLDRAKQHLSTSTRGYHSTKEKLEQRHSEQHSPRDTLRRPSSSGTHKASPTKHRYTHEGFDETLTGTRFGTETRRSSGYDPHSISSYSRTSNHAYGDKASSSRRYVMDKENQDIVKRFEEVSNRNTHRGGHEMGVDKRDKGSTSEISSAHRRALDFKQQSKHRGSSSGSHAATVDNSAALYRVARTQGQASRDIARGQSRQMADNYTLNSTAPNARRQSAASGSLRDDYASSHSLRGSKPGSRFHWDGGEE